jgi:hypothetical protein
LRDTGSPLTPEFLYRQDRDTQIESRGIDSSSARACGGVLRSVV